MSISLQLPDSIIRTERVPALVGRALEADIKIPELYSSVSRTHARIYVSAGRYYIEDLGSANGTKVDGVRVTGATPLTSSCRLGLGDLEAFLILTPASLPASPATVVAPAPLPSSAPAHDPLDAPASSPPAQQYSPPPQKLPSPPGQMPSPYSSPQPPQAVSPPRPRQIGEAAADNPDHVRLHRCLAWVAAGLMLVSFALPWVNALIFRFTYFGLLKEMVKAADFASELGGSINTSALFLPLIAFVLVVAVAALNHTLPLKQALRASAIGGGLALATATGIYVYASSVSGIDLSGMLSNGYYLFALASAALLVEGLALPRILLAMLAKDSR